MTRKLSTLLSAAALAMCASSVSAESQTTPWGDPDINGLWDFRSLTPLERPDEFGDRAVLTPEEAAAFLDKVKTGLKGDGRGADDRRDRR